MGKGFIENSMIGTKVDLQLRYYPLQTSCIFLHHLQDVQKQQKKEQQGD